MLGCYMGLLRPYNPSVEGFQSHIHDAAVPVIVHETLIAQKTLNKLGNELKATCRLHHSRCHPYLQ